jgi:hypothetical protein
MRNGEVIHPGADVELLSRWHDGELLPGERAHFEAHRAHCAACRRAAEEYAAAMTFFRGSRASRPPRDLSARILRKIQPGGVRRPPVGIVHGIDLRWAAVVILAAAAGVLSRTGLREPPELTMPIRLVTPPAEALVPPAEFSAATEPASPAEAPVPVVAAAPPRPARVPEARPVYPAPAQISAARLPAPRRVRAAAPVPTAVAASPQIRRSSERYGGEGAGGDLPAFSDAVVVHEPLEVRITSADAAGWPPEVRNAEEIRLPAEQRGLRYIIMVDPQGIVRAVETIVPSTARGGRVLGVVAPAEIWKIRFDANGRPRRLLIKID